MKRKTTLCWALVAMIVGAMAILDGCSASFTTASLSEATMAKSVDSTSQQPQEKSDTFGIDTPKIYVSAKVSNAPSETKVKATWVANDVAGVDKDFEIDSVEVSVEGTRYVSFSLSKPTSGWPLGKYSVSLSVDDKVVKSVPFTVAK